MDWRCKGHKTSRQGPAGPLRQGSGARLTRHHACASQHHDCLHISLSFPSNTIPALSVANFLCLHSTAPSSSKGFGPWCLVLGVQIGVLLQRGLNTSEHDLLMGWQKGWDKSNCQVNSS